MRTEKRKLIKRAVLIVVVVLLYWNLLPGHACYEVRDAPAQQVVCKIVQHAGWLVPLPDINVGPTHQKEYMGGLVIMYIDRASEATPARRIEPPPGNSPSFASFQPKAWADWAVQQFKDAGYADARITYQTDNSSLFVVDCPSALVNCSLTFRRYAPLMALP